MRAKTPKAVATFASTSDALAVECAAQAHGLPGRMIPVPSEISAGCGMAWYADATDRDVLVEQLDRQSLAYEGIYEVSMY